MEANLTGGLVRRRQPAAELATSREPMNEKVSGGFRVLAELSAPAGAVP